MPAVTRRTVTRLDADRLTDREVEYLVAWIDGGTKGAAHALERSEDTVKHTLANARSKVGVASTPQLVEVAIERVRRHRRMAQKRQ